MLLESSSMSPGTTFFHDVEVSLSRSPFFVAMEHDVRFHRIVVVLLSWMITTLFFHLFRVLAEFD